MSTQKYDSGLKILDNITDDISTTDLLDTGARTLTGIFGDASTDSIVWLYTSHDGTDWYNITTDTGDPYSLKINGSSNYIPLNPQFFYGLSLIKFVVQSGNVLEIKIIERMV